MTTKGNKLQFLGLWHQNSSLFHGGQQLACISYPILHPITTRIHQRLELCFLSPCPQSELWAVEMHGVWWANVIVIYQLLLSRTEMTDGMLHHCYLYR